MIRRRPRARPPSPSPKPAPKAKAKRVHKKKIADGNRGLAVKSRRERNVFVDDEAEGDDDDDDGDDDGDAEDDDFIDDGSPPESPWTQLDGRKGSYGDGGDDDDHPGMHHRGAMLEETPAFAATFGRRRRVADVQDTPEASQPGTGVTPAGQSQYEGSWIVDDEDDVEEEVDGSVEGGGWGTGGGGW